MSQMRKIADPEIRIYGSTERRFGAALAKYSNSVSDPIGSPRSASRLGPTSMGSAGLTLDQSMELASARLIRCGRHTARIVPRGTPLALSREAPCCHAAADRQTSFSSATQIAVREKQRMKVRDERQDIAVRLKKFMVGTGNHVHRQCDKRIGIVKHDHPFHPALGIAGFMHLVNERTRHGLATGRSLAHHADASVVELGEVSQPIEFRQRSLRIDDDGADILGVREI
jgi:hypothetical protein